MRHLCIRSKELAQAGGSPLGPRTHQRALFLKACSPICLAPPLRRHGASPHFPSPAPDSSAEEAAEVC